MQDDPLEVSSIHKKMLQMVLLSNMRYALRQARNNQIRLISLCHGVLHWGTARPFPKM